MGVFPALVLAFLSVIPAGNLLLPDTNSNSRRPRRIYGFFAPFAGIVAASSFIYSCCSAWIFG